MRHLNYWFFLIVFVIAGCAFSSTGAYTEYYVSPTGSDTSGDGSSGSPWRTINYALTHIDYSTTPPPRLNLDPGQYNEILNITQSIVIRGAGTERWVSSSTPDVPSSATSQIGAQSLDYKEHTISGAHVQIENLVISNGRTLVTSGAFIANDFRTECFSGLYSIKLEGVALFEINNSRIEIPGNYWCDLAIWVLNSKGTLDNIYAGAQFDHTLEIRGTETVLTIKNSEIEGSKIWYADGVRVGNVQYLKIENTRITRTTPDAEPARREYTWPHAGVDIITGTLLPSARPRIIIDGATIIGFDTGIGLSTEGWFIKVQNSYISGRTFDVWSSYLGTPGISYPVVDFGGGPLGSSGGNTFSTSSTWSVLQEINTFYPGVSGYDVWACFNTWGVAFSDIDPMRVYDELDNPMLGKVLHEGVPDTCGVPPRPTMADDMIITIPPTLSVSIPGQPETSIETFCLLGPGIQWGIVNRLPANQPLTIKGRGATSNWVVAQHPDHPTINCWLPEETVVIPDTDIFADLPTIQIPPLPTPTPTPTKEPVEKCYDQQQQQQIPCP